MPRRASRGSSRYAASVVLPDRALTPCPMHICAKDARGRLRVNDQFIFASKPAMDELASVGVIRRKAAHKYGRLCCEQHGDRVELCTRRLLATSSTRIEETCQKLRYFGVMLCPRLVQAPGPAPRVRNGPARAHHYMPASPAPLLGFHGALLDHAFASSFVHDHSYTTLKHHATCGLPIPQHQQTRARLDAHFANPVRTASFLDARRGTAT